MEADREDRAEAEDLGEQLSEAARAFGKRDLYRGDDGQLYAG